MLSFVSHCFYFPPRGCGVHELEVEAALKYSLWFIVGFKVEDLASLGKWIVRFVYFSFR